MSITPLQKRFTEETFRTRINIVLGITFLYILVLIPTYQLLGRSAAALTIVPLFIIVNLFGRHGGVIWAVSMIPLHGMVFLMLEGGGAFEIFGKGFWINHIALVLVGFVMGRLHDLRRQLQERLLKQKQVEKALRDSEAKYRSLFSHVGEGICIHDIIYDESGTETDYRIIDVNPAYESITGLKRGSVIGRKASQIYNTGKAPFLETYAKVTRTGVPESFEIYWEPMKKHFHISAFSPGKGRFATVFADITEQKKSEEALRDSEIRMRNIFNSLDEAVFVARDNRSLVDINESVQKMFGYSKEELMSLGVEVLHVDHEHYVEYGKRIKKAFGNDETTKFKYEGRRKNGEIFPLEATLLFLKNENGESNGMISVVRDLTEQNKMEEEKKRLEAHLLQAQKMEAIGTLAGGIAHDFNNILYPIIGCAELCLDDVPEESEARTNLEEILKAGKRAKELVQQILAFSQQGEQRRRPVPIQAVIRESIKLLRSSLPSSIEIKEDLDGNCGAVLANPSEIHQVLMNLYTNAYHAMREKGGILETRLRDMGSMRAFDGISLSSQKQGNVQENVAETTPLRSLPSSGNFMELTVRDTGTGMHAKVIQRMFEPFFTTKGPGEGTGMGLSVAHGIVESLGGIMKVESELGKGSIFYVYLPYVETDMTEKEDLSQKPIQGGHERILFVDDEEQIARLGKKLLERHGYEVVSQTSSQEALKNFSEHPGDFDLVITDMTMPKMTGADLSSEILKVRPDTPIILCTGFSEVMDEAQAKSIGVREYVMKPLVAEEIALTVRNVLDEEKEK